MKKRDLLFLCFAPLVIYAQSSIEVSRRLLSEVTSVIPAEVKLLGMTIKTDNLYHVSVSLRDKDGNTIKALSYTSFDGQQKDMFVLRDVDARLENDPNNALNVSSDRYVVVYNASDSDWRIVENIFSEHLRLKYNVYSHTCVHPAIEVVERFRGSWPWPGINDLGVAKTSTIRLGCTGIRAYQDNCVVM